MNLSGARSVIRVNRHTATLNTVNLNTDLNSLILSTPAQTPPKAAPWSDLQRVVMTA